jgi:hypothetical protein
LTASGNDEHGRGQVYSNDFSVWILIPQKQCHVTGSAGKIENAAGGGEVAIQSGGGVGGIGRGEAFGGGVYDEGTAMASFNFVEPYLRTVLAFIGVKDTNFINAGGTAVLNYGKVDRQAFLAPHLQSIRSQFHAA